MVPGPPVEKVIEWILLLLRLMAALFKVFPVFKGNREVLFAKQSRAEYPALLCVGGAPLFFYMDDI